MKNSILVAVILVIILGSLVWLAAPKSGEGELDNEPVTSTTSLSADKTFYDFGTISMKDGKVSTVFVLTNGTDSPVNTTKLYTSCMCTTAQFKQGEQTSDEFGMPGHGSVPPIVRTIAAGETVEIVATFDPAAHGPAGVGVIERVIRLETDKGVTELNFRTNVIP